MTVDEYDNDDYADDSDDQKKIRAAENRALRRMSRTKQHGKTFFNASPSSTTSASIVNPINTSNPGSGVSARPFQGSERNIFRNLDQLESHTPQADVSNVGRSGTGDVSITMHPHSRQKQPQEKKSQNDKFFIDLYEGQNIECIFDYFQGNGLYMQQTFLAHLRPEGTKVWVNMPK